MSKPRVAIFDFAGCEGDELQIVNLEESLLGLLGHVEVVTFREAMKERTDDYDIAIVEGSCTRPEDEEKLKHIRECASIVIAIGSCAAIGGINSLKNHLDPAWYRAEVYGDKADWFDTYKARPISAVIPIEAAVPGCPIDRDEFLHVVKTLLLGRTPDIPNYPICVECKKNENVCAFDRGEVCVGPVTRAGCNSCCVNEGTKCWGCRGLIDDPEKNAHMEVLEAHGLTPDEVIKNFQTYFGWEGDQ